MSILQIEIHTPEKLFFKDEVESVIVPAFNGELGIFPGHQHYIAQLVHGKIRLNKADTTTYILIPSGFMEIFRNLVELFVPSAEIWIQESRLKKATV